MTLERVVWTGSVIAVGLIALIVVAGVTGQIGVLMPAGVAFLMGIIVMAYLFWREY